MDRSRDSDKEALERVLDSGELPSASTSKPSRTSKSTPLGEQKCCLGLTYFSQAMHEKGSMPVRRLVQNCRAYVLRASAPQCKLQQSLTACSVRSVLHGAVQKAPPSTSRPDAKHSRGGHHRAWRLF